MECGCICFTFGSKLLRKALSGEPVCWQRCFHGEFWVFCAFFNALLANILGLVTITIAVTAVLNGRGCKLV